MKNAMTPEEWAEFHADDWAFLSSYRFTRTTSDGAHDVPDEAHSIATGEYGHAMAAACLHGKPYGFTREDVEVLRAIAHHTLNRDPAEPFANPPAAEKLLGIADRIEALLPPEAP